MYVCVCVCLCVYVCVHVCVYVCVCLCVHVSNSVELTDFTLGTNIKQNKVHLKYKVKVTLIDAEGHR